MRVLFVLTLVVAAGGCGGQQSEVVPAKPSDEDAGPVLVPATGKPAELVENPQYKNWAAFKPGTTAVHRSVTETVGVEGKTVTTTTYTLVAVTPDHLTLRSQIRYQRYDGHETNDPADEYRVARLVDLPPGVAKEDFGKPIKNAEQGEETLTAAGKEYKARWYKGKASNEGGQVSGQTWVSDQAPGGLVKSVSLTSGVNKKTVIELVEVKTP